jgi:RimJ/RimL family protein N-acetyltransferase
MLQGERVRLRALEADDAATMWRWYRDREFSVLDGNIYGTSLAAVEAFVRELGTPSYTDASFGIEDEHGALIGIVRLKRGAPEDRRADFGIAIAREHWNQGYGTDATRTVLRFAFGEMNLHRVALGVLDYNTRARRVYDKCGFIEEGRLRAARYRSGRWCDEILMAILAEDWANTDRDETPADQ